MDRWFKQLFSESSGVSMMRVMSFISLMAGCALAFVCIGKSPIDYSGISLLVSVFLSAAFGGKVMQKRIESNGAKSDSTVDTRAGSAKQTPDNPD
jgi:hypothetical protein